MLIVHLDGVPACLLAETTPVEPDPVNTGVGIEMCSPPLLRPE